MNAKLGELLPQQIIIVRALPGLGDMLCAIPAFRALRQAFPQAHITLLGLAWATSFVNRFKHYLDDFIEFPGYPGLPEQEPPLRQLPAFFSQMQQRGFDLALQMHGNGLNINAFTVLLGARLNASYFLPGLYCPDESCFLPYPGHQPEIRRHLRLMEFLGIPSQGEALEFPLSADDWQQFNNIPEAKTLRSNEYVCLHPGAKASDRCWPVERFALVADALAAQGVQVVLTGTAGEKELTKAVQHAMHAPALDLAGRTSLGALAALLSRARLLICNDTGVSHLAAALNVPSVVIFNNSNINRWAPLDHNRHRSLYTLAEDELNHPCAALSTARCLQDDCMAPGGQPVATLQGVTPAAVLEEVDNMMREAMYEVL